MTMHTDSIPSLATVGNRDVCSPLRLLDKSGRVGGLQGWTESQTWFIPEVLEVLL